VNGCRVGASQERYRGGGSGGRAAVFPRDGGATAAFCAADTAGKDDGHRSAGYRFPKLSVENTNRIYENQIVVMSKNPQNTVLH